MVRVVAWDPWVLSSSPVGHWIKIHQEVDSACHSSEVGKMSTSVLVLVRGTLHQRHSRVPTNDATSSHRLHSIERVTLDNGKHGNVACWWTSKPIHQKKITELSECIHKWKRKYMKKLMKIDKWKKQMQVSDPRQWRSIVHYCLSFVSIPCYVMMSLFQC